MEMKESTNLKLESNCVKKLPYPKFLNETLVRTWLKIPGKEWRSTPLIPLDLSKEGYGKVFIKDESVNPTGTFKDRMAYKLAIFYKRIAEEFDEHIKKGKFSKNNFQSEEVLRMSVLTSGNTAMALAGMFEKYQLPPPKLLIDNKIPPKKLEKLKNLRADIYLTDLSKKQFNDKDILQLTDNPNGLDITSFNQAMIEETGEIIKIVYYDDLFYEVINEQPHIVIFPYGSGQLSDDFRYLQKISLWAEYYRQGVINVGFAPDDRLTADPFKVASCFLLAAEPKNSNSIADKLTAPFKPFTMLTNEKLLLESIERGLPLTSLTIATEEVFIEEAVRQTQRHGIKVEPSGATSLALYLQLNREKLFEPEQKIICINTGKGMLE